VTEIVALRRATTGTAPHSTAPVRYNRFAVHGRFVLAADGDTPAHRAEFRYDGVFVSIGCPPRFRLSFANPQAT
jgi:hypothetical protein